MKKWIFLDIDGTVVTEQGEIFFIHFGDDSCYHPSFCEYRNQSKANPICIANLNWLCEHNDCSIVISSGWGKTNDLDSMKDYFLEWGFRYCSKIVDVIYCDFEVEPQFEKDMVIKKYIEEKLGYDDKFIIFDDFQLGDPELSIKQIVTDSVMGITLRDVRRADASFVTM